MPLETLEDRLRELAEPGAEKPDFRGPGVAEKSVAEDLDRLRRAHEVGSIVANGAEDEIPELVDEAFGLAVQAQPVAEGDVVRGGFLFPRQALQGAQGARQAGFLPQAQVAVRQQRPGEVKGSRDRGAPAEQDGDPAEVGRGDSAPAPRPRVEDGHVEPARIFDQVFAPDALQNALQRGAAAHGDVVAVVEDDAVARIFERIHFSTDVGTPLDEQGAATGLGQVEGCDEPGQTGPDHRDGRGRISHRVAQGRLVRAPLPAADLGDPCPTCRRPSIPALGFDPVSRIPDIPAREYPQ